jgi:solute carrier family 35 protein E1
MRSFLLVSCVLAVAAKQYGASPALRLRGGAQPVKAVVPGVAQPRAISAVKSGGLRGGNIGGIDFALIAYFAGWYYFNYYYTLNNKYALNAAGGSTGFPVTVGFLQMAIGAVYALFLWTAPDARALPKVTMNDLIAFLPVAACSAGAHISSIFSMNLGAVSFAQIVKAAEPAFAALLGVTMYGKTVSKAKWLSLIPVIGGVCLASIKELDFSVIALLAACIANLFAAFRSNENKKLMDSEGLADRVGSTGNQFAVSTILGTLCLLPVWLLTEASSFGKFMEVFKSTPALRNNLFTSGIYFYLYNELSTLTIKKTSAATQSVANTAKRVIVIVGVAIALGESLEPIKLLGCSIGIGGVLLYSLVK